MAISTPVPDIDGDKWNLAASKARDAVESATAMGRHAASAVGAMASQAACKVRQTADDEIARAGAGIQELGDRLGQNAPHAGVLGTASQAVAKSVRDGGEYLGEVKLGGMTDDLAKLIRRNPIPAVLIGIGLGLFVGHKLRR